MTDPDRTFAGAPPYYQNVGWTFHVTRGLAAEEEDHGIGLEQWRGCVADDAALRLEQDYRQPNIDLGVTEVWRELGRTRWGGDTEWADHFHYMPACITATLAMHLPNPLLSDRFQRAVAALGQFPTLGHWRDYVGSSRVLRLEERVTLSGKVHYFPGRAVTTARGGGAIRYLPACVWIYAGPDVQGVSRWAKCGQIAACLEARVVFGHRIEWS